LGAEPQPSHHRSGLLYALAAYGMWGLVPLYFKSVPTSAQEIVAHRVLWSAVFLAVLLTILRRWPDASAAFRSRKTLLMLFASAYLVAGNWLIYVWATLHEQITQASLGYFILPLVNVFAGIAFFGDRLRPPQAVALLIAAAGVVYLAVGLGEFPWISLTLAVSFALYGIVRKVVPVDGVVGLSVETVLLAPAALILLAVLASGGSLTFGRDRPTDLLIAASGIITTLPLICFVQAVRRVSLVTIGVVQYLSPSLQLVVAVLVYGEAFSTRHQISFGLIWAGLAVYVADAVRVAARRREEGPTEEPVPEPLDGGVPLTESQIVRSVGPARRLP
jgi:chloramphenicol-sensitive protein RarD